MPGIFDILKFLIQAFPSPTPPYCLIGALTLGAWGRPRATSDVDVLIMFDDSTQDQLISVLTERGFTLDTVWQEANPMLHGVMLRLHYADIPVDLLAPRDAQEQSALERRRLIDVEGVALWTVSPEDLILMKLKAGRPYDFGDAITVVARQGNSLDRDYLFIWARRLGLFEELSYVLNTEPPQ